MSRIELQVFRDGDTSTDTASVIYENFYGQSVDSLAVINGDIDYSMISTLTEITYMQVQTFAFSYGQQVGGTANLDYFSGGSGLSAGYGWFAGVGENPSNVPNRWLAIPGANMRIHLPYDAYVLVMWSVTWANDSQSDNRESHIGFFVDDAPPDDHTLALSPYVRRVKRSQFGATHGSSPSGKSAIMDRYKTRVYSGHYFTSQPLAAGYHDIGLKVCASSGTKNQIKQTRVRARSLKYIYFRKGATF